VHKRGQFVSERSLGCTLSRPLDRNRVEFEDL
jgi:hypothetical protein